MNSYLQILDYIWMYLTFGTFLISIFYMGTIFLQYAFPSARSNDMKVFWQIQFSLVFLLLTLAVLFQFNSADFKQSCFDYFLNSKNSELSITRLLSLFWILTFASMIFKDFVVNMNFSQRLRLQEIKLSTELDLFLTNISLNHKVKKPIIYLMNKSNSPFVYGLFRSKICIPQFFLTKLDIKTQKSILAHELVHIAENDLFWNFLEHTIKRIFFFHPFVYLVKKQYEICQEMKADQIAIQITGATKKEYALSFILLAEQIQELGSFHFSSLASSSFKILETRIKNLGKINSHRTSHSFRLFVLFYTVLLTTWAITEAQANFTLRNSKLEDIRMCAQVKHELNLEQLFGVPKKDLFRCE